MHAVHRASKRERGRAVRSGPVRAAAALLVSATALAGCGGGSRYPSFLPKSTLDPSVDTVALTVTFARPALTVEGLAVDVKTHAFGVVVTVEGPVVPGEGLAYQTAATTCTWTVTMKDATADVPVSLGDFHSVDHLGSVVPALVPGEARLRPRCSTRGRRSLFGSAPTSSSGSGGLMQWAPDHRHVVANWDYSVEND